MEFENKKGDALFRNFWFFEQNTNGSKLCFGYLPNPNVIKIILRCFFRSAPTGQNGIYFCWWSESEIFRESHAFYLIPHDVDWNWNTTNYLTEIKRNQKTTTTFTITTHFHHHHHFHRPPSSPLSPSPLFTTIFTIIFTITVFSQLSPSPPSSHLRIFHCHTTLLPSPNLY